MAVIVNATFDGATSGEATAASTGAAAALGAAAGRQHSTTQKIGGASAHFTGSTASYLQWTPAGDFIDAFARLYVRRETLPTGAANRVFAVWTDSYFEYKVQLAFQPSTGNLIVTNGNAVYASYPFTQGQWYRVDWSVQYNAGQTQRVRLYTGATIHSSNTADAVAGGTPVTSNSISYLRYLYVGNYVDASADFYVDEVVVDNATLPAPFVPPAAGRRIERKVAGTWVPHLVEKKVAGVWQPQIVERKDAGVWS